MGGASFTVVDEAGETVGTYPEGPRAGDTARERALAHAARINGRVFRRDAHGYLSLIHGQRSSPVTARAT